jgi:hypothetical protein
MDEDRDKDKSIKLVPTHIDKTHRIVSLDVVKSAFIAEGLNAQEISDRYFISLGQVEKIITDHKLADLRKAYILEGVSKIQNEQVSQAQRLLDVELNFKKLRIVQLEKQLEDFLAYYARHGDFYKRHPVSGDILKDNDGISMQVHVPNVSAEIHQLKESVTLSEGLKKLLSTLDDIINGTPKGEAVGDAEGEVIDMAQIDGLFKKRV